MSASNGTSTTNDSGATMSSSVVNNIQGGKNLANNAASSAFSSRRPNVPAIVGAIWGSLMLLLLITFVVILLRRRPVQTTGVRSRFDTIRRRKTPKLPIQTPPLSGISPGLAPAGSKGQNPFLDYSDLEKGVEFLPEEEPFKDDARVKMPAVPEMSVARDAYGDGWSGKLRDQGNARPTVPIRPARPPMLDLPT